MKLSIKIFAVIACSIIVTGCSSQTKEFTEKKLVIASKETAKIRELDLSITNNGCGRMWESGGERPYCDLVIKHNDSTIHAGSDFKPIRIGNIEITVDKMNPWSRKEDSIPPGGCLVTITRLTGLQIKPNR